MGLSRSDTAQDGSSWVTLSVINAMTVHMEYLTVDKKGSFGERKSKQ